MDAKIPLIDWFISIMISIMSTTWIIHVLLWTKQLKHFVLSLQDSHYSCADCGATHQRDILVCTIWGLTLESSCLRPTPWHIRTLLCATSSMRRCPLFGRRSLQCWLACGWASVKKLNPEFPCCRFTRPRLAFFNPCHSAGVNANQLASGHSRSQKFHVKKNSLHCHRRTLLCMGEIERSQPNFGAIAGRPPATCCSRDLVTRPDPKSKNTRSPEYVTTADVAASGESKWRRLLLQFSRVLTETRMARQTWKSSLSLHRPPRILIFLQDP